MAGFGYHQKWPSRNLCRLVHLGFRCQMHVDVLSFESPTRMFGSHWDLSVHLLLSQSGMEPQAPCFWHLFSSFGFHVHSEGTFRKPEHRVASNTFQKGVPILWLLLGGHEVQADRRRQHSLPAPRTAPFSLRCTKRREHSLCDS